MQLIDELGLSHRINAYPSRISGGEAARAALAVALSMRPQILLADEPTGEVDAGTEKLVSNLIEQFCRNGGTALIATHSRSLAARAGRLLTLRDGRLSDEH